VQSANAEAGLIPLSHARSAGLRDVGEYIDIPTRLYPPIRQAAIIPRASPNKDAARAFLAFLKQPEVLKLLAESGFGVAR